MDKHEKIAAAAIKIGDEVFTGPVHFACMQKVIALPIDPKQIVSMLVSAVDGFITDTGRFVDRNEAFELASASRQLKDVAQANPAANMDFYGTPKPSLDSGLIESYAPMQHGY